MNLLVTGGSGMVGRALREVVPDAFYLSSLDCDLRNKEETFDFFNKNNFDHVIHMAARVGGVKANTDYVGDFYYDNICINTNVLEASRVFGIKKVLSLLSTCVYPDAEMVKYPLTENQIHNGPPHKSNFGYANAKRMIDIQSRAYRQQFGCNFITAVPNNLYGRWDNFHLEDGHVIPAIIRKIYEATLNDDDVVFWGDGEPLREFTYSNDLVKILIFLMDKYNGKHPVNVGNTAEYSIKEVVNTVVDILEFEGKITWDTSKPKGQFKKPSSNDILLNMGWNEYNYTSLADGLEKTCEWFVDSYPCVRGVDV